MENVQSADWVQVNIYPAHFLIIPPSLSLILKAHAMSTLSSWKRREEQKKLFVELQWKDSLFFKISRSEFWGPLNKR